MSLFIMQLAHDVIIAAVAAAAFIFVVWTLSEVFGLTRTARRASANPAAPVPGSDSAPKSDRLTAAGRR